MVYVVIQMFIYNLAAAFCFNSKSNSSYLAEMNEYLGDRTSYFDTIMTNIWSTKWILPGQQNHLKNPLTYCNYKH